jgi:tetraacyldisaccharide 4'-kinase
LYFAFRGLKDGAWWGSLPQRLGFLPHPYRQTGPGAIWLHAVSVGEVLACQELLKRLRREFPNSTLFVSTTTVAGQKLARERLAGLASVFYAPVDYCFAIRRVLRTLKPSLVVIAETEIWPNLFREVRRIECGLAIVNGRISDRALIRYRRYRGFFEHVLPLADAVLAQSEEMRDRYVSIGAPERLALSAGNLKYDFEPKPAAADSPVRQFIEGSGAHSVWIAASTMGPAEPGDIDEDEVVIEAFGKLAVAHPRLLLVLVPRKPERFDTVAAKLAATKIHFMRRSTLPGKLELPGVLLVDSIGELGGLFPLADLVFMGGTLAKRGGHNILEPACFGRAVVIGPHMENFPDIARQFLAAGGCVAIANSAALAGTVDALLSDSDKTLSIGKRALECSQERRGATERTVAHLRAIYDARVPRYRPAWPWFPLAWLLAKVWKWGGRRRMRAAVLNRKSLDAAVISIGNITMGGTGKTPCVLTLAREYAARGHRPGILTRGYGRSSPDKHLVLAAGAAARAEQSGDEPQIFVRSGVAPVGIGPDRYHTGFQLQETFGTDVLLLDDGFQHVRLTRRVDIVLVDALDPFGGREIFPLGRLREPLSGLARADVFIITRASHSDLAPAVERTLRRFNERAPIFQAGVAAEAWIELASGASHPATKPPFTRVAAFCGLGNPQSFRRTVASLGIDIVAWTEFDDHHRYRPNELRRLVGLSVECRAEAIVTTEKDVVNLCDGCEDLLGALPVYWLRVSMKIDGIDRLMATLNP